MSDIPDDEILDVLAVTAGKHNDHPIVAQDSCLWFVEGHMPWRHPKAVLAKLRSMVGRDVVHGCTCGCRGDFHLPGTNPGCCAPLGYTESRAYYGSAIGKR